jgi:hypothetical protein
MQKTIVKRTIVQFIIGIIFPIVGLFFLAVVRSIAFEFGIHLSFLASMGGMMLVLVIGIPIYSSLVIALVHKLFFGPHKITFLRFGIGAILGGVSGILVLCLSGLAKIPEAFVFAVYYPVVVIGCMVGYYLPGLLRRAKKQ